MGVKVGLSGLTFQLIFCDLFKVEFYKFRRIFNIGEYINIFLVAKSFLPSSFYHSYRSCSPLHLLFDWQKQLDQISISDKAN